MKKFNELYESILTEGKKHRLYLYDGDRAVAELKKKGVKATVTDYQPSNGDNYDWVDVDLKDKKKVLQWLLDNGFEIDEIDPELGGKYGLNEGKSKILKVYKTPLPVFNGGKKNGNVYYAAVKLGDTRFDKGEPSFILVKDYKKPADTIVAGGWGVKSLLYSDRPIGDSLYIDAGQEWGVTGLNKIKKNLEKDFPKGDYVDPLSDLKLNEGKYSRGDKVVAIRDTTDAGTIGVVIDKGDEFIVDMYQGQYMYVEPVDRESFIDLDVFEVVSKDFKKEI